MFKLPIDQLSNYRLHTLYDKGFRPRTILDIGAYKGEWSQSMKKIFPFSKYFMVEGNKQCEPFLQKTDIPYQISMLSNYKKTISYYNHNGLDKSGNSVYRERTDAYSDKNCNVEKVECDTLSNIVKMRKISDIDFIKLDVQGSEKDVINGGIDIIQNAKIILIELQLVEYNQGAPMLSDMILYMKNIGFKLFDIIELHYTPNHVLLQVDALFEKDNDIDSVKYFT